VPLPSLSVRYCTPRAPARAGSITRPSGVRTLKSIAPGSSVFRMMITEPVVSEKRSSSSVEDWKRMLE